MAGRLGRGGGPGSGGVPTLFPPEPQVLQEGEGELAQQGVVVQPAPGTPLEVAEPQLALELLVHLLAHPARLNQGGQGLQRRVGRVVGQGVLALAGGAGLADEPGPLPGGGAGAWWAGARARSPGARGSRASQAASPGRCRPCAATGPSATRTRRAA